MEFKKDVLKRLEAHGKNQHYLDFNQLIYDRRGDVSKIDEALVSRKNQGNEKKSEQSMRCDGITITDNDPKIKTVAVCENYEIDLQVRAKMAELNVDCVRNADQTPVSYEILLN
ncbi:hypothetical protein RF11_05675 [Thelohanellus kitauei]|uniref:Uncharacterized protein n=1 Tax=Thelohanellus kitauei TaxID=669202 RepID=A0A0C2M788_THEKT|nr:hypothetical protein RF11_05675 [Thelohanellus kitauei]